MVTTNTAKVSVFGVLALVIMTFCCQLPEALGAEPNAGLEAETQAIGKLLQRQLVPAVNARDYKAVRASLTHDWTYVTSAGRKRNFEDWKQLVQRYAVFRFEVTDVRTRLSDDGSLAWTTFCGRIQGKVDGDPDDRTVLFTAIINKAEDQWKLRHLQGTESAQSC